MQAHAAELMDHVVQRAHGNADLPGEIRTVDWSSEVAGDRGLDALKNPVLRDRVRGPGSPGFDACRNGVIDRGEQRLLDGSCDGGQLDTLRGIEWGEQD